MNAWMISYSFYEIDYRVRRYAEALVKAGHGVEVFALQKGDLPREEDIHGVKLHRIQNRQINEHSPLTFFFRILLFFLRVTWIVTTKSVKSRSGLIHVHNVPDFLVFTALIPKLFGSKIILDIHDILPEFYCQKFGISMKHPLARALRLIEYLSVHFADHVITANDLWRNKIIERNKLRPETCTTLLNFPDEIFFLAAQERNRTQANGFKIIYPGTISHLHGIDIAIRAMRPLCERIPQAQLEIYSSRTGGFPYFDQLNLLVDELDMNESVSFHPSVSHEKIAALLAGADVGIVPKRTGIFASEAFSTKILEFMAAGVPVVASRTKIDEYYFDESVITYFKPDDPEDLAHQILAIHLDPQIRDEKITRAREYMRDKNWNEKKSTYYAIVSNLVGCKIATLSPRQTGVVR